MKKIVTALIVLLLMGAVLYFSSQVGGVSHSLSQRVAYKIITVMEMGGNETPSLYRMDMIVRKLAHFFEYLLLGIFLAVAFTNLLGRALYGVPVAGILGVVFAFGDEWVQSGSPGRTQSLFDVMVDAAGLGVGLMVFFIVLLWVRKKQRKRIISSKP